MTESQFIKMTRELKREFEQMFTSNQLDGVVDILRKYHPTGKRATTPAQVNIAAVCVRPHKDWKEVPLCTITPATDLLNKHAGVAFGIIPHLVRRIRVPKPSKQEARKLPRLSEIMKQEAGRLRRLGKIEEAKALEVRAKRIRSR